MKFRRAISLTKNAVAALAPVATGGSASVQTHDRPHIQREMIDSMFLAMCARAPWNVDDPLLWGYFFLDPCLEKLQRAASDLKGRDYRIVGIEPEEPGLFKLHVERVETHSPASLDARNQDFYALAEHYGIDYDGMDAVPPPVA